MTPTNGGFNPFLDTAAGLASGIFGNAGPAGPSVSNGGTTSTNVGGLTVNKKPDWWLIVGAFAVGGAVVWALRN